MIVSQKTCIFGTVHLRMRCLRLSFACSALTTVTCNSNAAASVGLKTAYLHVAWNRVAHWINGSDDLIYLNEVYFSVVFSASYGSLGALMILFCGFIYRRGCSTRLRVATRHTHMVDRAGSRAASCFQDLSSRTYLIFLHYLMRTLSGGSR